MSLTILLQALLVLVVSSRADNLMNGPYMEGSAGVDANGFLRLTNTTKHAYGQAFSNEPTRFKDSANGTVDSFSVTFFFAIVPEQKQRGSHGMAFVISPTKGIPGAFPDRYLGIFNDTNNGNSSNHIIAIELDTHKDDEFGDRDDNHVGININGLNSVKSASAGYYDQDDNFRSLSLISGTLLRLSLVYSQPQKQIDVTLSPAQDSPPKKPLLSLNQDLSPYMLEDMYFGFTGSTGSVGAIHYLWISYFFPYVTYPDPEFAQIPILPPYPRKTSTRTRNILVVCLTLSVFVAVVASVLGLFLYSRHKKVMEVLEEWEIQYGPYKFTYKELFKATKGFKDKQLLGKGGFGKVYKGTLPVSNAEIAVKQISHESRQGMREFVAEIATIGRLRHPNLVRLLGYCRHKSELYLVYDFMPNGSLDKFLYRNPNQQLTWSQRFKIIRDVASALFYLHHQWVQVVIHRDIKPANVLIDHEMNARLGDFGLAKLYDHGYDPQTSNVAGTFGYISPEHVRTGKATTSTDTFAFGMFMLEVTSGRRPIEPRAAPEKAVLVEWILDRWENGEILEAVDEKLRQEHCGEQVELVLRLGMLCSHPVAANRPAMSTVMQILDGVSRLPDNLLDVVKARVDVSREAVDSVTPEKSFGSLTFTEPFTSRGR